MGRRVGGRRGGRVERGGEGRGARGVVRGGERRGARGVVRGEGTGRMGGRG